MKRLGGSMGNKEPAVPDVVCSGLLRTIITRVPAGMATAEGLVEVTTGGATVSGLAAFRLALRDHVSRQAV